MQTEVLRKLDAGLMSLVTGGALADSGLIPVFIRAGTQDLARVADELTSEGGRVRHVIEPFGAVSAWLPIGAVAGFAEKPFVQAIEMAQHVVVAQA